MRLYVPNCESLAYVSAATDLTLASSWQSRALAQFAAWRGKHSLPRDWSRRCGKNSWLLSLYGAMPEPSTADRGVALWISSLGGSPVSPTVLPETVKALTTSAISGPIPVGLSCKPGPVSSSSRTSRGCSPAAVRVACTMTFNDWVTSLRADCSQRRKLARRTAANGSSSSAWPTPDAAVFNDQQSVEAYTTRKERELAKGYNGNGGGTPLGMAVKLWPSPQAHDAQAPKTAEQIERHRANQPKRKGGGPPGVSNLNERAVLWATPKAMTGGPNSKRDERGSGGHDLQEQVGMWQTPQTDSFRSRGGDRKDEQGLDQQARNWPTPTNQDAESSRRHGYMITGNAGTTLHDAMDQFHSSRQDPAIETDGNESSNERRILNPLFVEWLMGFPPGWTASECSATALSLWSSRMRSELLQLEPPREAPAQLSLLI